MKNLLLLIIVFCIGMNLKAQSDTLNPFRKNELGVDFGPMLLVSMGVRPHNQPAGITYRRALSEKWYFRVSAGITNAPEDFITDDFVSRAQNPNNTVNVLHSHGKIYGGRIGIEKRKKLGTRAFILVGIDLLLRHDDRSIVISEYRNNSQTPGSWGPYPTFPNEQIRRLYRKNETKDQFGPSASVGLLFPIKSRWNFSFLWRMEATYSSVRAFETEYQSGRSKVSRFSNFDFNMGPIIAEMNLAYRF